MNHDDFKTMHDVAHDLRSCLAVMRTTAEANLIDADAEHQGVFSSIIEQVDRMTSLLGRLPNADH